MKKTLKIIAVTVISSLLLCACTKTKIEIPFTDFTFDSSISDVIAGEGEEINSYPSIYYGTTHVFNKAYAGAEGSIKYMTDKDDNIINIAWTYVGDDDAVINALYGQILADLKKTYGESRNSDGVNNFVEVWELEDGHVILSSMLTTDAKALQLAYLSQAAVDFNSENN